MCCEERSISRSHRPIRTHLPDRTMPPPPKVVPTKEQIKAAICNCNDSDNTLPEVLTQALAARQFDKLLECVSEVCDESTQVRINSTLLYSLKSEFALLGEKTALGYVKSWISKLRTSRQCASNYCLLITYLVRCVNLLQSSHLREFLKVELPTLYIELLSFRCTGAASLICQCLFEIIAVEAAYNYDADLKRLEDCWNRIQQNTVSRKSPIVSLCSLLLASMMGLDAGKYLEALTDIEDCIEEMSDDLKEPLLCPKTQFFSLLLANIGTVSSMCSSSQNLSLIGALVTFHSQHNSLHTVANSIYESLHLPNVNATSLCRHLFYSILQLFPDLVRENVQGSVMESSNCSQPIANFGIWLSKVGQVLIDEHNDQDVPSTSRRSPEEVWAKVMSKYFEHVSLQRKRYLLVCKNDRLMHTILMLTDERCPLCAMSPIVGGTLLGALLQLITVADESYFAIVLRSIVAIFRWNSAYCRGLLARCGLKACKPFERLAMRGQAYGCMEDTRILLTEYLLSSSTGSIFVEKGAGILRMLPLQDIEWDLCSMLVSSVSTAFSMLRKELLLDEATISSRFLSDRVLPLVEKQLNASGCVGVEGANIEHLELFISTLSVLRELQLVEKKLRVDLHMGAQIECAAKICAVICGRKRKTHLAEHLQSNSDLIAAALDFLLAQGEHADVMKWRCLTAIISNRKDVVEKILADASVQELQCLLHSQIKSSSVRHVLEVCVVVGTLQNDQKRAVLLEVFDDIMRMMVDVVAEDARLVLRLARVLFPQVSGSTNGRRLLSFVLGVISISFPFLVESTVMTDEDAELLVEIVNTLLEGIRWCASSVTDEQCALYAQLCLRTIQAVQRYAATSPSNIALLARNVYGVSSVTHAIAMHKAPFSRIAPFIISDCLRGTKDVDLALRHLLSICDRYGVALLTSNLPPSQKRAFAHLYSHYHKECARFEGGQ